MKLHPFDDVVEQALAAMAQGCTIHQQFTCSHCGTKQTMDKPNIFFSKGLCEECGNETDIGKDGCNFLAIFEVR